MTAAAAHAASLSTTSAPPVFAIILVGGALSGALIRDIRLANELHDRGYGVHVWWAIAQSRSAALNPAIPQHLLFSGMRFMAGALPKPVATAAMDLAGKALNRVFDDRRRAHWLQKRPHVLARTMEPLMQALCDGIEQHRSIIRRLAQAFHDAGVTHVLPMLEMLCPFVDAARRVHPELCGGIKYLVTFQGYELYSMYARSIGRERDLYDRLIETVDHSDYPAIAVSADYALRVHDDIGVPLDRLVAIPPGVPTVDAKDRLDAARAREIVRERFPGFDPQIPLITYLGRQDAEKGIDLLLYAAALLRQRGRALQLAIAGPTLWGDDYAAVCKRIAEELRLPVHWRRFVPDEVRSALFTISRAIVYPSIHREPFGMVPVEAVARGVPAVVPDYGGVAGTIAAEGVVAGLHFRGWDSGSLTDALDRLLTDDALHQKLSAAGPTVAAYYSVKRLGDRVLRHLGLA
jgi:glycosyltransferase involved in cell wall biosynthesis